MRRLYCLLPTFAAALGRRPSLSKRTPATLWLENASPVVMHVLRTLVSPCRTATGTMASQRRRISCGRWLRERQPYCSKAPARGEDARPAVVRGRQPCRGKRTPAPLQREDWGLPSKMLLSPVWLVCVLLSPAALLGFGAMGYSLQLAPGTSQAAEMGDVAKLPQQRWGVSVANTETPTNMGAHGERPWCIAARDGAIPRSGNSLGHYIHHVFVKGWVSPELRLGNNGCVFW